MYTRRPRKSNPLVRIPRIILARADIPTGAKELYGIVFSMWMTYHHRLYASNAVFTELFGVSERTIQRWLTILIRKGFLTRKLHHIKRALCYRTITPTASHPARWYTLIEIRKLRQPKRDCMLVEAVLMDRIRCTKHAVHPQTSITVAELMHWTGLSAYKVRRAVKEAARQHLVTLSVETRQGVAPPFSERWVISHFLA